jgi:hypothetical protein
MISKRAHETVGTNPMCAVLIIVLGRGLSCGRRLEFCVLKCKFRIEGTKMSVLVVKDLPFILRREVYGPLAALFSYPSTFDGISVFV